MDYAPAMPELTDERRKRLVKWYQNYVNKAVAAFEGWYPSRAFDLIEARHAHDSFVKELTGVAREIGYEHWSRLAIAYGFDPGVGDIEVKRIDIESNADSIAARTWEKFVENAMPSVDQLYPDRVVVNYRSEHGNSCKKITSYAKKLGYPTWGDLLLVAGYDVRDSFRSRNGTVSDEEYERLFDELARQYKQRPARTAKQVLEENDCPELRVLFSGSYCRNRFGVSVTQLLEQKGILDKERIGCTDEELIDAVEQLKDKYAASDDRPGGITQLISENRELARAVKQLNVDNGVAQRLLGTDFASYLIANGVLRKKEISSKKTGIGAEGCAAIIEGLKAKYAHAPRPAKLKDLKEDNEDYLLHATEVNKWIKVTTGQNPVGFLTDQQLLSPVSRPDSLPRPADEEIQAFYDKIGLKEVLDAAGELPGDKVVRFQSEVVGNERYDNAKNYEMLRLGDYITFELLGGVYAKGVFCGHELGTMRGNDLQKWGIADKLRAIESGEIVGDRIYAKVVNIAGKQKMPSAVVDVIYVKSFEKLNIVNDVLLSRDGKKALRYDGTGDKLDIPEGVEVIPPFAFHKLCVSKVKFPNTLREIGAHAFRLCACRDYRIPASVEKIGDGAFSYCSKLELRRNPDSLGLTPCGPVHVEAAPGNERYYSVEGSLIERNGDQRRLVSLCYKGVSERAYYNGRYPKLVVPDGVTAIAPYCVSDAGEYSYYLILPGSLRTIEESAFKENSGYGYYASEVSLLSIDFPAWPIDVSPLDKVEGLRDLKEFRDLDVTFTVKKPQHGADDHTSCDAAASCSCAPMSAPAIARAYCEARVAAGLEAWPPISPESGNYHEEKDGLLFVEFGGEVHDWSRAAVRAGEFSVAKVPGFGSGITLTFNDGASGGSMGLDSGALAYMGDCLVGRVFYKTSGNPFQSHPAFEVAKKKEVPLNDDVAAFSFTDPKTGKTIDYYFCFGSEDSESELEFLAEKASDSLPLEPSGDLPLEFELVREFAEAEGRGAGFCAEPEERPALNEVVRDFQKLGGIGAPFAVYSDRRDPGDIEDGGVAEVKIRMAFNLKKALA